MQQKQVDALIVIREIENASLQDKLSLNSSTVDELLINIPALTSTYLERPPPYEEEGPLELRLAPAIMPY